MISDKHALICLLPWCVSHFVVVPERHQISSGLIYKTDLSIKFESTKLSFKTVRIKCLKSKFIIELILWSLNIRESCHWTPALNLIYEISLFNLLSITFPRLTLPFCFQNPWKSWKSWKELNMLYSKRVSK